LLLRHYSADALHFGESAVKIQVSITVNGTVHQEEIEPRTLLAHFLRENCKLTGTHVGCETSICGACTVLLNGETVKSCAILAVQANGAEITTIEGVADGDKLHPVQEGFWKCHGLQCGYCTPGMILSTVQLLKRNARPTREEIAHGLEGNLCRCTGYSHIIDAVDYAAKKMAKTK
jgi:carbon-monoxide dehydrogenase small subunit